MKHSLSRAVIALGIAMSLWLTSVAAVAAPRRTQDPKSSSSQQKDKDNAKPQPATTQTARTKPLSTNEDPTMIGKRNINKGIWGKMAGGTESEVKIGRQLAAQVEREAKFVDDPIITEYVNRVGQNIVLHSDAKIPFTIKVIDSDEVNAFAFAGRFLLRQQGTDSGGGQRSRVGRRDGARNCARCRASRDGKPAQDADSRLRYAGRNSVGRRHNR